MSIDLLLLTLHLENYPFNAEWKTKIIDNKFYKELLLMK